MRKLLIAALVAAGPAMAGDLVARRGQDTVRLTDKPCVNKKVLDLVAQRLPGLSGFQAATAVVDRKRYSACWLRVQGGAYLTYEDGDQGRIPDSMLSEDRGV